MGHKATDATVLTPRPAHAAPPGDPNSIINILLRKQQGVMSPISGASAFKPYVVPATAVPPADPQLQLSLDALQHTSQHSAVAATKLLQAHDGVSASVGPQPVAASVCAVMERQQQQLQQSSGGRVNSVAAAAAWWVTEESRELQKKAAFVLGEGAAAAGRAERVASIAQAAAPCNTGSNRLESAAAASKGEGLLVEVAGAISEAAAAPGMEEGRLKGAGWAEAVVDEFMEVFGDSKLQQQRVLLQEQAATLGKQQEGLRVHKGRMSPKSLQRAYDEGIER